MFSVDGGLWIQMAASLVALLGSSDNADWFKILLSYSCRAE
jgi:hypothetical protein